MNSVPGCPIFLPPCDSLHPLPKARQNWWSLFLRSKHLPCSSGVSLMKSRKAQSGDRRGVSGSRRVGGVRRSPGNNGLLGGAFSMLDPSVGRALSDVGFYGVVWGNVGS